MKKLLVLTMALVMLAFALPALADPDSNDINGNGLAAGNTIGNKSNNNQFRDANFGDQSSGAINHSTITMNGNGSNNDDHSDNSFGMMNKSGLYVGNSFNDVGSNNTVNMNDYSSASLLNKSTVTVSGTGNGNTIGNSNYYLGVDLTAVNSLNNNKVYVGDMTYAFESQYQYAHQYDHQVDFSSTFQNTTDCNFFIPINPVHLSQSNTGLTGGDFAGAVVGFSSNAFNAGGGSIQGMFGVSLNTGGVAQNQAAANVVTAFSAQ